MAEEDTKNPVAVWDITFSAKLNKQERIMEFADEYFKTWSFQLEQGEKTKYEHFQFRGSLADKESGGVGKQRKLAFMKILHKEKFKVQPGSVSPTCSNAVYHDDEDYVTKDATRLDGPWSSKDMTAAYIPIDMRFDPEWNTMQRYVLDVAKTIATRRKIHAIKDADGNNGKSFIATWMYARGLAHYVPFFTEAKELMRMVMAMTSTKKGGSNLFFVDLPRALSHKAEHEIYGAIEQLKTGIIYDDRYRFRMKIIDPVHVIVFTNKIPNWNLVSSDRWVVADCQTGMQVNAPDRRASKKLLFVPMAPDPDMIVEDAFEKSIVEETDDDASVVDSVRSVVSTRSDASVKAGTFGTRASTSKD